MTKNIFLPIFSLPNNSIDLCSRKKPPLANQWRREAHLEEYLMKKRDYMRNRPIRSSVAVRENTIHRDQRNPVWPDESLEYHPLFPQDYVFTPLCDGDVKVFMQAVYIDCCLRAYGGFFSLCKDTTECIYLCSSSVDKFPFFQKTEGGISEIIVAFQNSEYLVEKINLINSPLLKRTMFFDSMLYDKRKYRNALSQAVMQLRSQVFQGSFRFNIDSLYSVEIDKAVYHINERGAYSVEHSRCPFLITCTIPLIQNVF